MAQVEKSNTETLPHSAKATVAKANSEDAGVYINPLTDFGFKRIFGTEANKDLLTDFLDRFQIGHKQKNKKNILRISN